MAFDYAAKIRALLANADSMEADGNDEAAATFRAKALEWMDRYKIAEEAAIAEDPTYAEPIVVMIDVHYRSYEVRMAYLQMATILADHTEVKVVVGHLAGDGYRVTVVGYEGDVRYFEFLWTSAVLMFSTKIDPHWDPSRAEAENVFYLRQAGITRKEIADSAWGNGAGDLAANRSKVQRIYLSEAKARGEDAAATGLGFQAKDYRRAYAEAFVTTLNRRLRRARDAANAIGGVVVLAGRAERVAEAFYMRFPRMRPSTEVATPYVDPRTTCERCKRAASGACRQHPIYRWTAAMERRWQAQQNGASAQAGRSSGRQAAEGVVLRGTSSPTARRVEASNQALEG
jgi:hypothetical protein